MFTYLYNVGSAFSVLINVICGGRVGWPVCATMYQRRRDGRFNIVPVLDAVLSREHCRRCWVNAIKRDRKKG
jgi:hypothetical protein